MKLYQVTDYNHGFGYPTWIDPEMICKVTTGGKIQIDHSLMGYGSKPEEMETISERSVWVYLRGLGNNSSVRLTWEAWEKLRAGAGIEVEVL